MLARAPLKTSQSRWTPGWVFEGASLQVDWLREFTLRFRNWEEQKDAYKPLEYIERNGMRAVVLWMNLDDV